MLAPNNPELKPWLEIPLNSDFSIQNLPYGVAKIGEGYRVLSAIGPFAVNLHALHELGYFEGLDLPVGIFAEKYLNPFISLGQGSWRALRQRLSDLLKLDTSYDLPTRKGDWSRVFIEREGLDMQMPVFVRDYTDFYSSEYHAFNVGSMFRDPNNALLPNWKHLPVGYHGRASSIIVSGTPIHRPKGQLKPNDENPVFGPCRLLDFELEMAFIVGKENELGQSVSTAEARDHMFGMVIFNDWSARDIQKWEYVPLGPFLAKSFASSISPWVVTMDALQPFTVEGPKQEPEVLDYLKFEGDKHLDIQLEVDILSEGGSLATVCQSNHKFLYWNIDQQLAHHTVNGCNLHIGDMMASGTISGPEEGTYGSMLEITWRGTKPVIMPDGSERKFIKDGDKVIMKAWAEKDGVRVGFGEVNTKVLPAG
ncbi:MAG: fumarylacetoacetase [Bacteroidia bacterium]|nr:fumarylacetoacetase [Bacteroidia bacterium]